MLNEKELIAKQRTDIQCELQELDLKSIRALRAEETERLIELEAKAVELRNKLKELEV